MEGISNAIWGPVYWKMFHYVTITYPICPKDEDKHRIKVFFCDIVPFILPCPFCRSHYQQNLIINSLTDEILEIKFKLVLWLINMHNYVNKQLGKNEMTMEDALISLFINDGDSNRINTNANLQMHKKEYSIDKFKKLMETVICVNSNNYVYDIDDVIKQKEIQLENEKTLENAKPPKINKTEEEMEKEKIATEAYMEHIRSTTQFKPKRQDNYTTVTITKQDKIDMNVIMDKILQRIEKCDDERTKYLIYTGFESICMIF